MNLKNILNNKKWHLMTHYGNPTGRFLSFFAIFSAIYYYQLDSSYHKFYNLFWDIQLEYGSLYLWIFIILVISLIDFCWIMPMFLILILVSMITYGYFIWKFIIFLSLFFQLVSILSIFFIIILAISIPIFMIYKKYNKKS